MDKSKIIDPFSHILHKRDCFIVRFRGDGYFGKFETLKEAQDARNAQLQLKKEINLEEFNPMSNIYHQTESFIVRFRCGYMNYEKEFKTFGEAETDRDTKLLECLEDENFKKGHLTTLKKFRKSKKIKLS